MQRTCSVHAVHMPCICRAGTHLRVKVDGSVEVRPPHVHLAPAQGASGARTRACTLARLHSHQAAQSSGSTLQQFREAALAPAGRRRWRRRSRRQVRRRTRRRQPAGEMAISRDGWKVQPREIAGGCRKQCAGVRVRECGLALGCSSGVGSGVGLGFGSGIGARFSSEARLVAVDRVHEVAFRQVPHTQGAVLT